jgi:hypothetical protein
MRYRDAEAWAIDYLAGLVDSRGRRVYTQTPAVAPGPASDEMMQKISPDEIVFMTVGGGAASTVEGLFDNPFITVRTIGAQNDYQSAEDLAWYMDKGLLAIPDNGYMGEARIKPVARTGGVPALLSQDNASRYHFICSYIVETQAEGAIA